MSNSYKTKTVFFYITRTLVLLAILVAIIGMVWFVASLFTSSDPIDEAAPENTNTEEVVSEEPSGTATVPGVVSDSEEEEPNEMTVTATITQDDGEQKSENKQKKEEKPKQKAEPKPKPEPAPKPPKTEVSKSTGKSNTPQTGPEDAFYLLAIPALAYAVTSYKKSKQELESVNSEQ